MSFNSRNNNSRNSQNFSSARKPHCAHCQNTGETESVYASHWPKSLPDRTGKTTVTCPKLLQTECGYCYGFGHTRKFCDVLKANQKARELEDRRSKSEQQQPKQQPKQQKVVTFGGFAALADDSDDEEVNFKPVKEEWPTLSTSINRTSSVTIGYAAMAAKPARVYEPEPETPVSSYQVLVPSVRMTKTKEENWPTLSDTSVATKKTYPKGSWAAESDSDTEDEDEDEIKAPVLKPFVRDAWDD